jgi:hypothetical protein
LVRDLIPDLTADDGSVLEKLEGQVVTANVDAFIVSDKRRGRRLELLDLTH